MLNKYPVKEQYFKEYFEGNKLKPAAFDALLNKLDSTKSPGSPLVYTCSSNKQLLDIKSVLYNVINERLLMRKKFIDAVVDKKNGKLTKDFWFKYFFLEKKSAVAFAMSLVKNGCADPVLVTFKGEPRKVGKLPRLISQVSALDNILQRLVIGDYLLEEQCYSTSPTATALDITTQTVTKNMWHDWKSLNMPLYSSDVQGWEYSVTPDLYFRNFVRQCHVMCLVDNNFDVIPEKLDHFKQLLMMNLCIVYRVNQTNEGELVVPPYGQMISGALDTFSSNSAMRADLANQISFDVTGLNCAYIKTAGDDCLDSNPDFTANYKLRGFVVTDVTIQHDVFNFCSTTFTEDFSYQDNIQKFIYNLLLKECKLSGEYLVAFNAAFYYHPEKQRYIDLFNELSLN
jgi:hypothetical protein